MAGEEVWWLGPVCLAATWPSLGRKIMTSLGPPLPRAGSGTSFGLLGPYANGPKTSPRSAPDGVFTNRRTGLRPRRNAGSPGRIPGLKETINPAKSLATTTHEAKANPKTLDLTSQAGERYHGG